jgi:hypothetical protein
MKERDKYELDYCGNRKADVVNFGEGKTFSLYFEF